MVGVCALYNVKRRQYCLATCSGDLNSTCEVKGAPVDMMLFVLNADDNVVAFCEQRDAKGVSALSCYSLQFLSS